MAGAHPKAEATQLQEPGPARYRYAMTGAFVTEQHRAPGARAAAA